ncbi:septal ring lytic transglycosylase RlpA family protein [Flavobacterium sp.]|jgi:rare lipoprotein A|uniref:septal ring lytic transglycosylase RlpA family protein n=1 Tax=Flavobacterium sp. TaxID=239 RepID=UPI003752FA25
MQKSIITFFLLTAILLFVSSFSVETKNSKKQEPKKIQDTLKKVTVVTEIKTDSVVIYKGKFKPFKKGAHASYYADRFHGKKTASGKIFDMNKLTAAHKKLPFGTKVKVTNEANGKVVFVEITDRGPFVKGREIDLSKKAFMTISGNKNSGKAIVTLEILQK